jgi:23S rRNA (cytosine1962-C5)-methyltransferase
MPSKDIPQTASPRAGKANRLPGNPNPTGERAPSGKSRAQSRPRAEIKGPYARISRRAADRLRGGHVWVYQSDLEKFVAPADESRLIAVLDERGLSLGTALYSASSQIALRLVSAGPLDAKAWTALVRERLRAAIRFRKGMPDSKNGRADACRLVFSEADFLPGMIADKYGDLVVLQLLTPGMDAPAVREIFLEVLAKELDPRAIFERADPRIRELEQLGASVEGPLYVKDGEKSGEPLSSTVFRLNGLNFQYDVNGGQKTGAFLDQRENYAVAARYCRGEALDVCTYHGGFALHLAQACSKVTGVDSSLAALEVAERNLALNRQALGTTEVEWVEANAFDLLREWSDAGSKFDSIVLDPPAFAKSKRAAEGALRGYKELNLRALKMLRPGGTLVTCSCSHHVSMEDFTATVTAAAVDAHRQVRLIERRGAAGDHPVLLGVPETEYLKCLICQVN